jgi:uncharacterized protein (TIGR04255 family)
MNKVPDERHPNSPLAEVVFEIAFPAETAIDCRRHEIQDRLRGSYPNLIVPAVQPGMLLAYEPYRFEQKDGSTGVILSLNRFGYYSRAYPGFEVFEAECLKLIELFSGFVPIKTLSGIVLRHINIIPFVRDGGVIPFEDSFVLGEKFLDLLPSKFDNLAMTFVLPIEGAKITTRIESISNNQTGQEAILLDFYHAKMGELYLSEVRNYLNEAHTQSASLFNRLITQSYRDYITGEEAE